MIFVSATPGLTSAQHSAQIVEQIVRPTGLIDPEVDHQARPKGRSTTCRAKSAHAWSAASAPWSPRLPRRWRKTSPITWSIWTSRCITCTAICKPSTRSEILRDLRLGVYDVVVGINLLREGLDLPEVTLVAILDADKEGFLRSETSLIQTIGRAARNV